LLVRVVAVAALECNKVGNIKVTRMVTINTNFMTFKKVLKHSFET
jgi:hypothetical protein